MYVCIFSGGYDKEEKAARAYDLAALKYWGPTATTNFPVILYTLSFHKYIIYGIYLIVIVSAHPLCVFLTFVHSFCFFFWFRYVGFKLCQGIGRNETCHQTRVYRFLAKVTHGVMFFHFLFLGVACVCFVAEIACLDVRKSSGFSRGASIYRGVTRHHQQGRWQARIGRVAGNKDLYLGTFGRSICVKRTCIIC